MSILWRFFFTGFCMQIFLCYSSKYINIIRMFEDVDLTIPISTDWVGFSNILRFPWLHYTSHGCDTPSNAKRQYPVEDELNLNVRNARARLFCIRGGTLPFALQACLSKMALWWTSNKLIYIWFRVWHCEATDFLFLFSIQIYVNNFDVAYLKLNQIQNLDAFLHLSFAHLFRSIRTYIYLTVTTLAILSPHLRSFI